MGISITQELPINPHKYFTLALGNWDLTLLKLGFGDFSPFEIGILGFHPFGNWDFGIPGPPPFQGPVSTAPSNTKNSALYMEILLRIFCPPFQ